jgi:hypothetical protein
MQRYGLVELEKGEGGKLIPHVTYDLLHWRCLPRHKAQKLAG